MKWPQERFSGSVRRKAVQEVASEGRLNVCLQVASGRLPGLGKVWRGRSCFGRYLGRSRDSWKVPARVPGKVLGDVACYRICATCDVVCAITRFFPSGLRKASQELPSGKLPKKWLQEGFPISIRMASQEMASGGLARKWLQDGAGSEAFLRSGFRVASQEVSRSCFRRVS